MRNKTVLQQLIGFYKETGN